LRPSSAAVDRSVSQRDLASDLLWEASLSRSLHRRELAAITRRNAPRRKGASLALSAAVVAAPVLPGLSAAEADSHSGARSAGPGQATNPDGARQAMPVLAAFGSSGWSVAAVQRALHVPADGLFGPQTRAAVRAFQERDGLPASGRVDLQTWVALFHSKVEIGGPAASAVTPARTARVAGAPTRTIHADVNRPLPAPLSTKPSRPAAAEHPTARRESAPPAHHKAVAKVHKTPRPDRSHAEAAPPASGERHAPSAPKAPTKPPARTGAPVSFGAPSGSGGDLIAAMIAAASAIDSHHYAYSWGGGHNSSFSGPYDCSGAVSAVLHAAGLLNSPLVSGGFMNWGAPGAGAVTIYASPSHVYMSINGRFFGTSYANPGGGPGWFNGAPRSGFVVVHVPLNRLRAHARASSVRVHSASASSRSVRHYRSTRTYRRSYAASRTYSRSSASSAGTGASGGSAYPSRTYSAPAQERSTPAYSSSGSSSERSTPAYSSSAQTTPERSSAPAQTTPERSSAPASSSSPAPATHEQSAPAYSSPSPAAPTGAQAPAPAASSPSTHEQSGSVASPAQSTGGEQSTAPSSTGSSGSTSASKSSPAPAPTPAPTGAGESQSAPSSAPVATPPVAAPAPAGSSASTPAPSASASPSAASPSTGTASGSSASGSGASSPASSSSSSGTAASTGAQGAATGAAAPSGSGTGSTSASTGQASGTAGSSAGTSGQG